MKKLFLLLGCVALATTAIVQFAEPVGAVPPPGIPVIQWEKYTLDEKFRSEGVAIGDVNKDGKMDVMNGEYWYEAPDWKKHEMQAPADHKDGLGNYSRSFACWAEDINKDGWVDLIVIDFPGVPCYWMENPKEKGGHWKKHTIWHSACNETPQYVDLFGNGQRVLIMGFQPKPKEGEKEDGNMGQMAWFKPGSDVNTIWEMHPISVPSTKEARIPGTMRFSHGLGVGDINGDKRLDVITIGGWWEQPEKTDDKAWAFHPNGLGDAMADLYAHDIDGDGKADIIGSSAHKFGIWWFQQKPGKDHPSFVKQELFKELVSETHAMNMVDIDGDGLKDLVTGKRAYSHGTSEPGSRWPAMVYWFKAEKKKDGMTTFTPVVIDTDSGIGTQFEVADMNGDGKPDVIVSNKRGVFVHVQKSIKK